MMTFCQPKDDRSCVNKQFSRISSWYLNRNRDQISENVLFMLNFPDSVRNLSLHCHLKYTFGDHIVSDIRKWLSGCQLLFTNYILLQNAVDFTLLLWPHQRKFLAMVQSFIQVHTLTCLCNDEVLVTWGTKLNQSKIIVM